MQIGIIGAGSVGLLMSHYLHKQHDVTVYVRRIEQKEDIMRHGLILDHTSHISDIKVALIQELKEQELFVICVKQYQIANVIEQLEQINSQTPLLFLQNGMGHVDKIESLAQPIYLGVVEHGAYRVDDYSVHHTGKGQIKLASYNTMLEDLNHLRDQLHQEAFPFEIVSDWYTMLTDKLVVNAVINPLTALFDIKNGEIIHNEFIKQMAKDLCQEIAAILQLNAEEQWRKVKHIALTTSENTSSMLSDIQANRLTEIDAITGYLLRKSKHPAPLNSFVYHSIKAIEMKKGILTRYD